MKTLFTRTLLLAALTAFTACGANTDDDRNADSARPAGQLTAVDQTTQDATVLLEILEEDDSKAPEEPAAEQAEQQGAANGCSRCISFSADSACLRRSWKVSSISLIILIAMYVLHMIG